MNYNNLIEYIQSFNGKVYKLKDVNGNQGVTSAVMVKAYMGLPYEDYSAGTAAVEGKLSPNDSRPDYYAPYKYNYEGDNKRFEAIIMQHSTITSGNDTRPCYIGPVCTNAVADGKRRMFVLNGGGSGEGDESAKAVIQYVTEMVNIDDVFKPIQKALGIELLTEVSDEAKAWVRDIDNIENMHKGYYEYVEGEYVEHQPFDYPTFDTVADNIYVRMCINDTNLVMDNYNAIDVQVSGGKSKGSFIFVYIDPFEGKTYFPYDLVQAFSNIINTCNGFSTSDTNISGNLSVGTYPTFTKTWCVWNNANTVSTKTFNDIINERVAGRPAVWQYPNIGSTTATLRIWCSDNGKIGRIYNGSSGSSSNYNYYNAMSSGSAQAGPWTRYNLTLTRQNSSADSPWVLSSETISTGSISEINGYSGEYFAGGVSGSNIGYAKSSNLIGTKPSTPSNIQSSYATWYNNSVDLVCYESYPFTDSFDPLNYKRTKKLLAMSVGEDAGEGKTQQDVQGGETNGKDLDDSGSSDKAIIEDEGETIDGYDTIGIGSGFFHLYYTSAGSIQDVYTKALQNDDLGDLIAKFYAGDLGKAILDVYRLPFICDSTDRQDIKLSNVTLQGVEGYEQHNRIHLIDFGTITVPRKFGDQRDYSPITRVNIYLPFSGYQNLDVDDIMGASVHLRCKIDKMSGKGIYEIKVSRGEMEAILYTFPMSCRLEYPVSYNQARTLFSQGLAAAGAGAMAMTGGGFTLGINHYAVGPDPNNGGKLTAAMTTDTARIGLPDSKLVRSAANAASTLGAINMMKPVQARGGQIGDAAGWLASMVPCIIINRPNYGEPDSFESLIGIAANTDVLLGDIHGKTVVREVRLDGIERATSQELEDLRSILMSGAIL